MTDGLECSTCTELMYDTSDPIKYYLDRPMATVPGTFWTYNEANVYIIYQLIERKTGYELKDWQNQFLYGPLNIRNTNDGRINHIKPRDMAQIGQLILNKGKWNGKQIISENWINRSLERSAFPSANTDYGYYWWINDFDYGNEQTITTYSAQGHGGQMIFVVPQLDMVIVFTGNAATTENLVSEKIIFVRDFILPSVNTF